MKKCLQIILFLFLTCVAISALAFFIWNRPKNSAGFRKITSATSVRPSPGAFVAKKLSARSASLKNYCKSKGYNMDYCFMIDMSLPSGKDRFFIYDLDKNSVRGAGLVTHGAGSVRPGGQLVFSNKPGSSCTSLGRYKIGKEYYGKFGVAYKLHGLDPGNDKAFERFVVLHAHACVPTFEVYPLSICPSLGCPTVSPQFLQTLKTLIDRSGKPVLLYIYQ
jgi:hypothetical protein